MGPVQILVVGFERPALSGEVLTELARLGEAGSWLAPGDVAVPETLIARRTS